MAPPRQQDVIIPASKWLLDERVSCQDAEVKVEYLLQVGLTSGEVLQAMKIAHDYSDPAEYSRESDMMEAESDFDEMQVKAQIAQALHRLSVRFGGGHPDGPAHAWHSRRRADMLKKPAVKAFLHQCSTSRPKELFIQMTLAATIACCHFGIAQWLSSYAMSFNCWNRLLSVACSEYCWWTSCFRTPGPESRAVSRVFNSFHT
jgi:hypothetical protein